MARRNKRVLAVLFGTLLLDTIGFGIVFPIIPILFTDTTSPLFMLGAYDKHTQLLLAGFITALFGLMQFLAAPILGELSDVYGRKRLLATGVAVLAASQVLFGIGIEFKVLALLFIARIVAGAAAANFSIAQATIADVTDPKDRAKNFGLIGAAFGLGFIIGPSLSGWLTGLTGDPATAFWVAGLLGFINVFLILFFLPETRIVSEKTRASFTLLKGIRNIRIALKDVDARPLYTTNFLYLCGFSTFFSFVGIMLVSVYGFEEAEVGTFFAIMGVFIFITQAFLLRIVTNVYVETQIVRYTFLAVATVLALYPFMPDSSYVYLLIPLLAIPQGLTVANLTSLVSKSVSAERQGAALGINGSVMALAGGSMPLVAGAIAAFFGIQYVFLCGSFLIILAWLNLFVFQKRRA